MVDDHLTRSTNQFLERLSDDQGCCHGTRPMFGRTRVHWGVYFTISWSLILLWCYMLLQVPQMDSLFADPPMYTLNITASFSPETCALLFLCKSPRTILDQFLSFKEDGYAPEWTLWTQFIWFVQLQIGHTCYWHPYSTSGAACRYILVYFLRVALISGRKVKVQNKYYCIAKYLANDILAIHSVHCQYLLKWIKRKSK